MKIQVRALASLAVSVLLTMGIWSCQADDATTYPANFDAGGGDAAASDGGSDSGGGSDTGGGNDTGGNSDTGGNNDSGGNNDAGSDASDGATE